MTQPTNPAAPPVPVDLDALVTDAANAWDKHVAATTAMNAARPEVATAATPAERELYNERWKVAAEAKSEHWRTAIDLAMHSHALIAEARAKRAAEQRADAAEVAHQRYCKDWDIRQRVKALEEALQRGLEMAVLTLAFHGRDRGTDREQKMLDDLEQVARETDAVIRAALKGSSHAD